MEKGAFAERRGEIREPLVVETSGPEPVAPPLPPGPPEPVLLFKPPEPSRVGRAARVLLSSSAGEGGSSITLLTWIVAGLCAAVWSVVGAVFWLPVVLGSILHFGVAHLQAMLDGRVPREAGASVRSAASFYVRGFAAALDVARPASAEPPGGGSSSFAGEDPVQKRRLLRATGWACVSWYAALFIVGALDWPHIELWALLSESEGAVADLASSLGSATARALTDLTGAAARMSTEVVPDS